jgi:DNA-binding MarR family transcriptional regulator
VSSSGSSGAEPIRAHDDVLGYLLKHTYVALQQRMDAALADTGLTARDLGVLRLIAGRPAPSQQEISTVLGVDRTSMVALLDALERRGIILRRPAERDRRRNVVELTDTGWNTFRRAESLHTEAEKAFTAMLGDPATADLRRILRRVLEIHGSTHGQQVT